MHGVTVVLSQLGVTMAAFVGERGFNPLNKVADRPKCDPKGATGGRL